MKNNKILLTAGGISVIIILAVSIIFYDETDCSEIYFGSGSSHCTCIGIQVDSTDNEKAGRDAAPYTTRCLGINLGKTKE